MKLRIIQFETALEKRKTVTNLNLSLAIDGAGAQASNYCPRYNTTEKGEPCRHDILKIKSTYVKVEAVHILLLPWL
jgi:hypothetical protein